MDFTGFFHGQYALGAIGVLVAGVLLALVRFLLPRADRDRAKIAAVYLALGVIAALGAWVSPDATTIAHTFEFFWWFFVLASCGRSVVLLAIDVFFGKKTHRTPPRIFRDLTQAVVYVIVLLLTLRAVGVEPGSLLTTSALLTAVVGLALQDTLGNLVSGLALQMQRPFEVGDWIQFESESRHVGQVTEVNWRATTVMTSDLVEVIVPNATLARAPIRNYSRPSIVSRRTITVQGPYDVPPHRVHDAIVSSLVGAPGVLADPAPWVRTSAFGDSGIEYTVLFFTDDYAGRDRRPPRQPRTYHPRSHRRQRPRPRLVRAPARAGGDPVPDAHGAHAPHLRGVGAPLSRARARPPRRDPALRGPLRRAAPRSSPYARRRGGDPALRAG